MHTHICIYIYVYMRERETEELHKGILSLTIQTSIIGLAFNQGFQSFGCKGLGPLNRNPKPQTV